MNFATSTYALTFCVLVTFFSFSFFLSRNVVLHPTHSLHPAHLRCLRYPLYIFCFTRTCTQSRSFSRTRVSLALRSFPLSIDGRLRMWWFNRDVPFLPKRSWKRSWKRTEKPGRPRIRRRRGRRRRRKKRIRGTEGEASDWLVSSLDQYFVACFRYPISVSREFGLWRGLLYP